MPSAGLLPDDKTFADIVRRSGKPVVLVANKAEARGAGAACWKPGKLGLGEPVPISAEHGQGMPDLRDAIIAALGEERAFAEEDEDATTDRRQRRADRRGHRRSRRGRRAGLRRHQADAHRRRRPAERRQVDADQRADRRGAAADRTGSRHHARFHLRRLGLARPPDQAVRHRRHAPQGQGAGKAGKAVGCRRAARHPLRRSRHHRLRRDDPVREAGSADRRPDHPRGPRAGDRLQQMGSDREPPGRRSPSCARRPSGCCRRCAASARCRSRPRPAAASTS